MTRQRIVGPSAGSFGSAHLQRKLACDAGGCRGSCAKCAEKPALLRRNAGTRHDLAGARAPALVHRVVGEPGRPLDGATRGFFEPRFGHDFSGVRVHTDERAAASARAVDALAYTVGPNVVFAAGQYAPGSPDGRATLAHELAHVVQQSTGRMSAGGDLTISGAESPAERAAGEAATRAMAGEDVRLPTSSSWAVSRIAAPYIKKVAVDLTPQHATLEWEGTPPATPGSDAFTVSTGKGYSNPEDSPGTCTRDCCSGADVQCAPPHDRPNKVGSCCTPVGSAFWTGVPRPEHNGWSYWTPVEPIHTAGGRGIALHQHTEVTGRAIGHGCIRMEPGPAERIFRYSRGRATNVTISGRATVDCPAERQCREQGARLDTQGGEQTAALVTPDEEAPA